MNRNRMTALLWAVLVTLSLAACAGEEPQVEVAAGIAVQVETVGTDTIATENNVSGRVFADDETMIMLSSAAKCTAVYAYAGDQVEAGDILCTLEMGSSLATYKAAKIGYDAAVKQYNDQKAILGKQIQQAKDNVENTKALFEIGAASRLEVDNAEISYQSALASQNSVLSQLEAGIQNAKSGLEQLDAVMENMDEDGNVIAPVSGTLTTMNAVENSYASNSLPLAVITGTEQMRVSVSVSEVLVPKLTIGDTAQVRIGAVDQTFEAEIRSVERAVNMQTQLYTVVLSVPEDITGLLSGMFADVTFHTEVSENAIVIPTEAVLTSNDTRYVYVVEDDIACYTEVTTGLNGNGVTEILSGLSAGQQLVTVGQAYLADGDPVRIVGGGT